MLATGLIGRLAGASQTKKGVSVMDISNLRRDASRGGGASLVLFCVIALSLILPACSGGGGGGGTAALVYEEFRLDGASHVPRNAAIEVRFNSPIDPSSVSETSFAVLRPNDDLFPGRVVVKGSSITFHATNLPGDVNDYDPPNFPRINGLGFDPNTRYRVRILGGEEFGIRNKRGRPLAFTEFLEFTTGFNFAEEDVPTFPVVDDVFSLAFSPPPVIEGDPLDPDPSREPMAIPRLHTVTVRFSEPMDPRSFDPLSSFTVTNITQTPSPLPGLGEPIPGSVVWSDDARSFSFDFRFSLGDNPFGADPWQFAIDMTQDLTDLAGNRLSPTESGGVFPDGSFRYFFTTEDVPGEPNFRTFVESFESTEYFDPIEGPPTAKWFGNGVLEGGDIRTRTTSLVDSRGLFNLNDPLVGGTVGDPGNNGSRFQMLFFPTDISQPAPGEVLTGMKFGPKSGYLFAATYRDMEIVLAERPDTLNRLVPRYEDNYDEPFTVFRGDFDVPNSLNTEWYPWPDFSQFFPYSGDRSIVFEVTVPPGAETYQLFENVSTSSIPRRRNIGPWTAQQATNSGENTTYNTQWSIARIRTFATSRWVDSEIDSPAYREPILDLDPDRPGTEVLIEWQGADADDDGNPINPTQWTDSIQQIDVSRFFRFRVTLIGDPLAGLVPSIRSISVVYEFR